MTPRSERFESASTTAPKLAAYSALLSDVFGSSPKFEPAAIAWRYRDNPVGEVVGMDAWDGDRLVAHYVTCPMEARVEGKLLKGLLSLNTATHPEYQGRGLFTALAEEAYVQGAAGGYDFVMGVANANSTPGFVRKLGFQLVGPLAAGFLLLKPRRFRDVACQYEAHWSEAAWRWRLANPVAHYAVAASGSLTGVWADTGLPLIRCAAYATSAVAHQKARSPLGASLFIGLEPRLDFRKSGFIPIPRRLRPSPLNLIWRPLREGAPRILDQERVSLNFLDFDPY